MIGTNKTLLSAALMLGLAIAPTAGAQDRNAAATITFSGGSVAAGVGYTWGNGVLNFEGKRYPFKVDGLGVVDLGVARIEGAGEVYNLGKLADFSGNYVATALFELRNGTTWRTFLLMTAAVTG